MIVLEGSERQARAGRPTVWLPKEAESPVLVERGLQSLWASGSCGEELGVERRGQTGGGKAEVWPWGCLPQHPIEKEQWGGGWGGGFSTTASSGPGPFPGGPSLAGPAAL